MTKEQVEQVENNQNNNNDPLAGVNKILADMLDTQKQAQSLVPVLFKELGQVEKLSHDGANRLYNLLVKGYESVKSLRFDDYGNKHVLTEREYKFPEHIAKQVKPVLDFAMAQNELAGAEKFKTAIKYINDTGYYKVRDNVAIAQATKTPAPFDLDKVMENLANRLNKNEISYDKAIATLALYMD